MKKFYCIQLKTDWNCQDDSLFKNGKYKADQVLNIRKKIGPHRYVFGKLCNNTCIFEDKKDAIYTKDNALRFYKNARVIRVGVTIHPYIKKKKKIS